VLTEQSLEAAHYAGPGVMLSFLIAGGACGLAALCYAELAATIPVSGSAYAYSYATLGEAFAWMLGWLLLFEYGVAASLLGTGFAGYATSLLSDFGISVPAAIGTPTVRAEVVTGHIVLSTGASANVLATVAIAAVTAVLARGLAASAVVNTVLVLFKVLVLGGLVIFGAHAINPHNWVPLVPPNEGGFAFGWSGVLRAASLVFFAYVGFETVSTAAAEARNPQRDLPIGILGSLAACTLIYILVSAVVTGIVPYRELGVPDPIAIAIDRTGVPVLAHIVKFGALAGLGSVLLVNAFGQSRVAFAMARDGLMPPLFARLGARVRTPSAGIIVFGLIAAAGAALLPLALLSDLTSIGTSLSFATVCFTVLWLRNTRPELARPFRVPLGGFRIGRWWIGWVPLGGLLMCLGMAAPVMLDVGGQAARGQWLPVAILGGYLLAGVALYMFYGFRHSKLGQDAAAAHQ
jgi:APA family basic amino acid/polyamine antiporter